MSAANLQSRTSRKVISGGPGGDGKWPTYTLVRASESWAITTEVKGSRFGRGGCGIVE